jgi:hypothetical protein
MKEVSEFSTWDMEDVGVFHENGVSNVGPHSFEPFNSSLQMPIATRVNLPILTSNHVFSNRVGLKRLEKFVGKRKSINEEVHNFQNTQEKNVQVVTPFEAQKKNNLEKRLHPKNKVVKVEEGEANGDEESKKSSKNYDVKALIALHGEMEPKFVKNTKKKEGKILVVTMCLSLGSFEILQAKKNSN